ncbi:hypothetical protein DSO57_1024295 [Entomophthora muscae]|uniref:Uncharacterized protein n=1 Tax=Entomophthora muscae TaxID=34485 RepID=A0ACC2TPY8_9FUNG|nr:hypothetical protein DSO57_1024295 [Entomophthora muscae]
MLVSSAVAAPGSKASVIFKTLRSKGLVPDLASHAKCFAVKAASLELPSMMVMAMLRSSLDAASADKSMWDPAPTSLEKAFALARKLGAKPALYYLQQVWQEVGELEASQGGDDQVDGHQPTKDLSMEVVSSEAPGKVR